MSKNVEQGKSSTRSNVYPKTSDTQFSEESNLEPWEIRIGDLSKYSTKELTNIAFAAARDKFEEAYETDGNETIDVTPHCLAEGCPDKPPEIPDDYEAINYLEEFAVPLFRKYREFDTQKGNNKNTKDLINRFIGITSEESEQKAHPDLERWQERIEDDIGKVVKDAPNFNAPIDGKIYSYFYDKLEEKYDPDEFDQIVGVYSSGMPFLYTASSYLEAEEVVLRYSTHKRNDKEVKVTDMMEKRQDFEGSDVLVVDDSRASNETLRNIGEYVLDRGAENVTAVVDDGFDIPEILLTYDDNNQIKLEE